MHLLIEEIRGRPDFAQPEEHKVARGALSLLVQVQEPCLHHFILLVLNSVLFVEVSAYIILCRIPREFEEVLGAELHEPDAAVE